MEVWDLLSDIGIASVLLLSCKVARTQIGLLQKLFIPTAMLAGLTGLIFGSGGLRLLPFSGAEVSYGGILIAVIFAAIGLSTQFPKMTDLIHRTGRLWTYNQIITISQWMLALAIGLYVLPLFWKDLAPAFGLVMPAGFMGGHGTATALGESLQQLGWEDAMSLGLTAATVGVFAAVLGGMLIINIAARIGILSSIDRFESLGIQTRRGLVPEGERQSIGDETVSSSSINVFTFHLSLVCAVTFLGYLFSGWASSLVEFVSVPVFASAFLIGCIARTALQAIGVMQHFDDRLFQSTAGAATDYLIFFGIASIKTAVVISNAAPFVLLIGAGLGLCAALVWVVAPLIFSENWMEKAIFSWGWMTGTVALGILLLRVSDPSNKSHVLDDYAIAYVPGAVVDILLISFVPGFVMLGLGGTVLACLAAYLGAILLLFLMVIRHRAAR